MRSEKMRNRKYKKISNWKLSYCLHVTFYFLFLTSYFLLLISLTACGRKGDPIAIEPYPEKAVENDLSKSNKNDNESNNILVEEETEAQELKVNMPDSPTGLIAIYTQQNIILIWDEIIGQDVRFYKIYRSTENGYILVGDTFTPTFTDKNVKSNTKYYYKVTAVGVSEGPSSKEIEIVTEVH